MIGQKHMTEEEKASLQSVDQNIRLQTAKGIAKVKQQLPVNLNKLADQSPSALMLDNCPPVLSMGKFVMEYNCDVIWKANTNPVVVFPNGEQVTLRLHNNVPLIAAPAFDAACNAACTSSPHSSSGALREHLSLIHI